MLKKYSACGPFTKHTQRIQYFLNTGELSNIYKNDLDKACFQHDMAYDKFKDLEKRAQSDIVLNNKAPKIASNPKYNGYERGLVSMVYNIYKLLKNKIYKYMTAISKNVYFDVLDYIVDEYNNTYHKTIKMKPIDFGDDSFAEYNEESNEKDPKFKIGDHV